MIDTISRSRDPRQTYRRGVEEQFLGCLLIGPERIREVADLVSSRDFEDVTLGKIYSLVVAMREAGQLIKPDAVRLLAEKRGLIDELDGLPGYIKIVKSVITGADYMVLAKELARLSACSQAELAVAPFLDDLARRDCDPRRAIESLIARVQDLGVTADAKQVRVHDVLAKIYADGFKPNEEHSKQRIATGFPSLDEMIGGLYAKSLVLLGGYFGSGKSALVTDIAARAVNDNKSVLLYSIEMTAEEFGQRILTIEAGISMFAWKRQRTSKEQDSIKAVTDLSKQWKFNIDETSRQSLSSIRAAARLRKSSPEGLDLLVIDNLSLISHQGDTRERYRAITIELKKLSRELDCCVLLVAQLNADSKKEEPDSTSWADCKSIQGDADVAMMLHQHARPESWTPSDLDRYSLIIAKNRSRGGTGKLPFTWDGEFQRFSENTGQLWKG